MPVKSTISYAVKTRSSSTSSSTRLRCVTACRSWCCVPLTRVNQIADRLCASIGQDILDCLFSRSTLEVISHRKVPTSHTLRPLVYFILALCYNGQCNKWWILTIPSSSVVLYSLAYTRHDLPDDLSQCRSQFLRPCSPDTPRIESVRGDQRQCFQEV